MNGKLVKILDKITQPGSPLEAFDHGAVALLVPLSWLVQSTIFSF
jgi:hypothetical protein